MQTLHIEILKKVLNDIFTANELREKNGDKVIGYDEDNEVILNILQNHLMDIVDIQEIDVDSEDFLEDFFGGDGNHLIRDAEAGFVLKNSYQLK